MQLTAFGVEVPWRQPCLEAMTDARPLFIGNGVPGSIAAATLVDDGVQEYSLKTKPSRCAARREGSLNASHFHS